MGKSKAKKPYTTKFIIKINGKDDTFLFKFGTVAIMIEIDDNNKKFICKIILRHKLDNILMSLAHLLLLGFIFYF